jgi:HNH endonuclease
MDRTQGPRYWQVIEGGDLVKRTSKRHPWYYLAQFGWEKSIRKTILAKYPTCQVCQRAGSVVVDHITPWISAKGIVSWALFSDLNNLRALCRPCDSTGTATHDRGFGNPARAGKEAQTMPTGSGGKEFASSTVPVHKMDEALSFDLADLLSDLPD